MPNDDYIKRSDALKAVCEYCSMHGDEGEPCSSRCGDYALVLKIPAADVEPKRRWIPVTERLPEKGQVVLAAGKRHATSGQFQGVSILPYHWWWKGHTLKEVHWWMPLPEPPKEDV